MAKVKNLLEKYMLQIKILGKKSAWYNWVWLKDF